VSSVLAPARLRVPRVLLAGGGTGGHVYPALAVVEEIEGDRLWVGSTGGREEPLVRRAGIDFRGVPTGAVLGRGPRAITRSAVQNVRGVLAARALIREYRPSVVLATGGYASVPVVIAARLAGVPSAIFLPDVEPGLAVKVLGRIANRVACSVETTRRFLPPAKVVPTGYPVRPDLRAWAARPDRRRAGRALLGVDDDRPLVLVMGGSTGARSINQAVWAALPRLLAVANVLHLAGGHGIAEARAVRDALAPDDRPRYRPEEYFHDEVGAALAAADLAVARAGASTLGELPAFGLPSILVPGTFAGGHQRHNAEHLADAGAAVRLADHELRDVDRLPSTVERLLEDPDRLDAMRRCARALDRPDAARDIARLLVDLASGALR
jgi:UDP-N-acetylglucosamine--N-acetylmuramyl-(pentapeptide) pyrophosphoryl-undecaprenol N-acetylglucosamine transferase